MPSTSTTENHSITYPSEGVKGWYATWESLAQQITDYLDNITNMRMAIIKDANGAESIIIGATASAVNEITVTNAATGNGPSIAATGDDTNVDLTISPKGSGTVNVSDLTVTTGTITTGTITTGTITTADINGGAIDGVTIGTNSPCTELDVDNININGNTISSSNANGNITLNPNGTGVIDISADVVPDVDSTHDLGSSSAAYALAYVDSLANGSTTAITLDANGHVTLPNQSAVGVNVNSNVNNVTGDGTAYTIAFDTERFDRNSDFSSTTFTAPVTGLYQINTSVYVSEPSAHTSVRLEVVTSNKTYILFDSDPADLANASGFYCIGASVLADMDALDTASVRLTVSGGAKDVDVLGSAGGGDTILTVHLVA